MLQDSKFVVSGRKTCRIRRPNSLISRCRVFSCGQISCRVVQKCTHKVSSCSRQNCYFQARLSILSASPTATFCDHNLNQAAYAAAIGGERYFADALSLAGAEVLLSCV